MGAMNSSNHILAMRTVGIAIVALAAAVAGAAPQAAQRPAQRAQTATTGSIEFTANVTPTDAHPQPVRDFAFYLLRKSLADIHAEVEAQDPPPKLDPFIDALEVTPELKAWMKKNQSVDLAGEDFFHKLKPEAILGVPEFFSAYVTYNTHYPGGDFPVTHAHASDEQKNPDRYARDVKAYRDALLKYVTANPQSANGMEVELAAVNPSQKWQALLSGERDRVQKRTLRLAQTQYLVTQADSDLNGQCAMSGIPPGDYWLGTLGERAQAGDVREAWDVSVAVRAGMTTRIALTNLNAVEPPTAAH